MDGCAGHEPFALRVIGDSMAPEFKDGSIIVVEPSGVLDHGCYVVAVHNDEYLLRQLIIQGGHWLLKPLNERYPTLEIPGIRAIRGRVMLQVGRSRRHRKHYRLTT